MNQETNKIIQASISRLLKPLVRLLLRYGVSFGVFADIAKRLFVEIALEEFTIPGRKPTVSRTSVITGLSRKEVLRVTRLPEIEAREIQDRYNRAVRVVTGWRRDGEFLDDKGDPKVLSMEGESGSFVQLVKRYSGDTPVRAIFDELSRSGTVEQLDSGGVRLTGIVYGPEGGIEEKIAILGSDVADLISTIDHNLTHSGRESRFQLKVAYDNIPREATKDFRASFPEKGLKFLQSLDKELSLLDRDTNSTVKGSGRIRAGVGIYYFEEELSGENGKGANAGPDSPIKDL